jgi:hypothetical protein
MKTQLERLEDVNKWSMAYSPLRPFRSLGLAFLASFGYWSLGSLLFGWEKSGYKLFENFSFGFGLVCISVASALIFWFTTRYAYYLHAHPIDEKLLPPLVEEAIRAQKGQKQ